MWCGNLNRLNRSARLTIGRDGEVSYLSVVEGKVANVNVQAIRGCPYFLCKMSLTKWWTFTGNSLISKEKITGRFGTNSLLYQILGNGQTSYC